MATKTITFEIDEKLADKFELAVQLTGDDRAAVAESFVKQYLAKALHAAAEEYHDPAEQTRQPQPEPQAQTRTRADSASRAAKIPGASAPPPVRPRRARPDHEMPPRDDRWWDFGREFNRSWGKAISRIPRWARNPQQNNHKILRAYFELQRELGKVTLDALRGRCSDPTGHPRTFVPHFDNNFAQMKFDNGNSHGKVFEERDGFVTIWDHINDTLMKYRDYFLR